ncbi:hypothetical protein K469DRAFT_698902 [Zopfia rhizophila CBS 207.26]|uniref:Uncharacterized protein n=1 Tax=Zopfia rhizophila CBS 207.26 TaxID=1314779 RepID=A0A6A6EWE6_9PEZI|nr:hypothetical protein K469DRAFT_698902 [Zopfia rhizophila CBS 207.26]
MLVPKREFLLKKFNLVRKCWFLCASAHSFLCRSLITDAINIGQHFGLGGEPDRSDRGQFDADKEVGGILSWESGAFL